MMNGADLLKSIKEKESKLREWQQSDPREVPEVLNRYDHIVALSAFITQNSTT